MTNEELVQLYQAGDKQALESLIEQNRGIIYTMANKFFIDKTNSIDREDLEQEGVIGLITAADKYKFDVENPCKFITYAIYWIRQKMQRYLSQKNTNNEISLNIPVNEDGDITLLDTVEDDCRAYENVEDRLYNQQLKQELEEAMCKCTTLKEREVLKLLYGWNGAKCMKYEEIGDMFNIPKQSVKNSQIRALSKLRKSGWGIRKAKEIGYFKRTNSYKNISRRIEYLDFESKYLHDDELNRWCDEVLKEYRMRVIG